MFFQIFQGLIELYTGPFRDTHGLDIEMKTEEKTYHYNYLIRLSLNLTSPIYNIYYGHSLFHRRNRQKTGRKDRSISV